MGAWIGIEIWDGTKIWAGARAWAGKKIRAWKMAGIRMEILLPWIKTLRAILVLQQMRDLAIKLLFFFQTS